MAVTIKAVKKVRELSPELKMIQLPADKKAKLVNKKIVIVKVVAKVAPKEEQKEVKKVEEIRNLKYTMRGLEYELPTSATDIYDSAERRRIEWLSENSKNQELRMAANELLSQHSNILNYRHEIEHEIFSILNAIDLNGCKVTRRVIQDQVDRFSGRWAAEAVNVAMRCIGHSDAVTGMVASEDQLQDLQKCAERRHSAIIAKIKAVRAARKSA